VTLVSTAAKGSGSGAVGAYAAAQYSQSVGQAITTSSNTILVLDTIDSTDGTGSSAFSLNTGTGVVTINRAGFLVVVGMVSFTATIAASQVVFASLVHSAYATEIRAYGSPSNLVGAGSGLAVPWGLKVSANDTIKLQTFQSSGSSRTTAGVKLILELLASS
jgi:hypothetical protein